MPITRTYHCPECNHRWELVLSADQWDDPPPSCSACDALETQQVFKPPAIVGAAGGARAQAAAIAQEIAATDYNVANMHIGNREGDRNKVTYKDTRPDGVAPSSWTGPQAKQMQIGQEALQSVLALGRETRLRHGSGLDVLQQTLATGDMPDLIEQSKKRSARIW